jgi:hypothetical protein
MGLIAKVGGFLAPHAGEHGNVVILFGLALPVLLGVTALTIDASVINHQKDWMQNVADEVSLAVAKELHLHGDRLDQIQSVGVSRAEAVIGVSSFAGRPHSVDVLADQEGGTVEVKLTMVAKPFFPAAVWSENPIVVTSTAQAYGNARLCVLGLNSSSGDTVIADNSASLAANECAVQSNSSDASGLRVKNGSAVTAAFVCTAGGYDASSGGSIDPDPEVDCPRLEDPLSARTPPSFSGCDFNDLVIDAGTQTISPGVYCGGLTIQGSADVVAAAGTYVFSGGKLVVKNNARFAGDHVSLYFADDAALLEFIDSARIRLTAPKEGPMAGMLIMEAATVPPGRSFTIKSPFADVLLGTIYLPKGVLTVESTGNVAEESAFTVIVADRINVTTADLVVNSDYAGTDVPVPDGLGPTSSMVTLHR